MLLPVDMRDWLPEDHLVWFVIDTVTALDTAGLERHRRLGGAGTAGYDPVMLLGLLVYAYCGGVRSSRRIEQLCHSRCGVPGAVRSAGPRPCHDREV